MMNKIRIFLCCTFVLGMLYLPGCVSKPSGYGEGTRLFVVADPEVWHALEPALRNAFEKTIYTPEPEKVFEVIWVAPERFNDFATRKNVALVGTLDSDGEISQKVDGMLAPGVKARVEDGSAFVFPKKNPWAKRQMLLVLTSTSVTELTHHLETNKRYLYELLENRLLEDTRRQMYSRLEQKELAAEALEKYGWTLRIQHDYFVNIERADANFYMLRRSLPGRERWLFVHWIENADRSVLNETWVLNKRDELTSKFYKNEDGVADRVYRQSNYLRVEEVNFQGRNALRVQGLWENLHESKGGGGPFRTYCFYDEASGRIYLIDIAVYFPGGDKEPFLRQLDVMAHTFRTLEEVRKEKAAEAS